MHDDAARGACADHDVVEIIRGVRHDPTLHDSTAKRYAVATSRRVDDVQRRPSPCLPLTVWGNTGNYLLPQIV